jgi:cytochrome c553
MKKTSFLFIIVSFITASFAFIKDKKPRYENLKVLPKNTDKHQMDSIMKHFSASLGVKCTFCHVRQTEGMKDFDFASDNNKHKLIARDMYKMMNKINSKYFSEGAEQKDENSTPVITCYSCHHGQAHPENAPSVPKKL